MTEQNQQIEGQEPDKKTKSKVIPIRATDEEKELIRNNAAACKMSLSRYLINLGTGYAPPSKLDAEHMRTLAKINGDQGRLGGLLRMWLSNEERVTPTIEQRLLSLIKSIEDYQKTLKDLAGKLK